jgi:diguanylate cyclase (GGDEF)-like protein
VDVHPTAEVLAPVLAASTLAFLLGQRLMASAKREQIRRLEQTVEQLERVDGERRSGVSQRAETAEQRVRQLERSLVEIPEIAQRLSATRDLREIPECALDLVQEIFDPEYAVFYRAARGGFVATCVRGDSEYAVGHRIARSEGIVGWAAVKQLSYTPEDAQHESGIVSGTNLAGGLPRKGFALALPVSSGTRTRGVILIGNFRREIPRWREIGRTIALITSVVIESALTLEKQRTLAKTDGLTGLLNRTHLLGRVHERIAADGGLHSIALFLFDIDHFKQYNDANGHLPGDELLKDLSSLLKDNTRDDEILGRYGGEEFLVAMPDVDRDAALQAAERIRQLIADNEFAFREKQPGGRVTVSGGVAVWPLDGDDVDAVLRRADEALYEAKRTGRNRVLPYAPPNLETAPFDPVTGAVEAALLEADEG